jgi:hypothetical protein
MAMKYRGFREEALIPAFKELEALGLKPAEAWAILNLAGAKWRSVQIREGRVDEYQDEGDSRVFRDATVALMKTTMTESQELARLVHAAEAERFMLAAIAITIDRLFSRGPKSIRKWLGEGEEETRKVVLSFAMGSSILVEPQAIDILVRRIVEFRYGTRAAAEEDIGDALVGLIERLGNSGYACLKPIAGTAI